MAGCIDDNAIAALLDGGGDLPADERAVLTEHLDTCVACRTLVADLVRADGAGEGGAPAGREVVLPPGATLGRYVVLATVGAGAMGVVYAAWDPQLGRKVALKLLRPDPTADDGDRDRADATGGDDDLAGPTATGDRDRDPGHRGDRDRDRGGDRVDDREPSDERASGGGRRRLLREARVLAQLAHPHVIAIHDVGTFGDEVFLAMEFVEGGTLGDWLARAPRSARDIARLFAQIGAGLAAAHAAGLVHRDLKPDNILVGADDRARVTDFGLSRIEGAPGGPGGAGGVPAAIDVGRVAMTMTGAMIGTPAYMAPELLAGAPANAASDQFAFCVTLYEALYGERPFVGLARATPPRFGARSPGGLAREASPPRFGARAARGGRPREASPPRFGARTPGGGTREASPRSGARVPGWLRAIVARGLVANPAQRYPNMAALLAAIHAGPIVSPRRIAIGATVLVALGLGSVAFALARKPAAEEPCTGAAAAWGATWDPARARALTAAFVTVAEGAPATTANGAGGGGDGAATANGATAGDRAATANGGGGGGDGATTAGGAGPRIDRARAEEYAARVGAALDERAAAWRAMHLAACTATRVRGEASEATLDLRMRCLDGRRRQIDALAGVLATADATTVGRAITAVSELPSLDDCANPRALAPAPRPSSPAARTELAALDDAFARADALSHAGKYTEAAAIARPSVERARALGYAPTLSRLVFAVGFAEQGLHDFPTAVDAYHDAAATALGVGDLADAADAWIALVRVVGVNLDRPAEARRFASYAAAMTTQLEDDEREGTRLRSLASVAWRRELKYDEARALIGRARALFDRVHGARYAFDTIACDEVLAGIDFDTGKVAEALVGHRRVDAARRTLYGETHPANGVSLVNIGEDLTRLGRAAEAIPVLERAVAQMAPNHADGADAYQFHRLAAALRAAGEPTRALAADEDSLASAARAGETNNYWESWPLSGKGLDLVALGRPAEAIAPLTRAVELREGHAQALEIAETELGLARALAATGDTARARTVATSARTRLAPDAARFGSYFAAQLADIDAFLATRH